MIEIANRIKETRLSRGMTQQELADACGLKSRTSINKIEKNTYEPGIESIKKIARALNVDPDYLIFGDREDKSERIMRLFGLLSASQQDEVLDFLQKKIQGR